MTKAMDDALLALFQNGERLRPENGYPVRLLLPGWEGKPVLSKHPVAQTVDSRDRQLRGSPA